ncbi:LysE family transporter [Ornithinimicrobium faecis]|uniref:LysE family transporter n=1 Tax=Ornithinimicrobium faecis TaxID=2934158 RepID=A0ABY4YQK6_9MICO|nr:LysE family transporter [Ornithinimicrobium sp. HY1793]USQ79060.1 LysE family transporter [Ornithinimicrobium sp. HY1793]
MNGVLVGLALGAAAGISPGPLLVLVITSALRGGSLAGVVAACAPLVSDVLVIAGTLLVLNQLPVQAVGWLALGGAVFVAWIGLQTVLDARGARLVAGAANERAEARAALRRAAMVNLLSPHPWLFWATVLGPLVLTTWRSAPIEAVALVLAFYVAIVGSKALIAVLVARGRHLLSDRAYRWALVIAGVLLVAAAVALAVEFWPVAFNG